MAMIAPPSHVIEPGEVVEAYAPLLPALSKEGVTFVLTGHTESGRRIFAASWSGISLGSYSVGTDDKEGKTIWRKVKKEGAV